MEPAAREFDLDAKFRQEEGTILMSGVQALVRLPIDQHRSDRRRGLRTGTFISGYPGSPLGGLDLQLHSRASYLREHDITFVPGVNEELAATAVWGSQQETLGQLRDLDGVVGFWFGKGPGIDRCGDVFKHANFMGVGANGGVLAIGGDDPSAKSSTLPNQSEPTFFDALFPTLYPGDIQDILDLGLHGLALSRYSGCWVGFKIVTNVADGIGTAEVGPTRVDPIDPRFELAGQPWRHQQFPMLLPPQSLDRERELYQGRLEAAKAYASANGLNRVLVSTPDDRIGIVAAGKTYFDVREALAGMALDDRELQRRGIRVLKIGMVFPLEPSVVTAFADGLREIIVVEEKRPFLELFVRDVLYNHANHPLVVGKVDEHGAALVPGTGELTAESIAAALAPRFNIDLAVIGASARKVQLVPVAAGGAAPLAVSRQPFFCSGCPHNRSTVVPEGSIATGGVGCHTMAIWMDRSTGGMVQMGGEGAFWIGRQPFADTPHVFQNLGDGTAFHSGTLAIRAAVAAGVTLTYKILYNGHVAMTGGQEVAGAMTVPDMTRALEAEGVKEIIVCSENPRAYGRGARWAPGVIVWERGRLDEAQRRLSLVKGVTALIYDQECAAEKRRSRKRGKLVEPTKRVFINESVCEGCGDCGRKSNCLSVQPTETEFGTKTQIHQSSCNKDYTCLEGDCPSFVTIEEGPAPDWTRRPPPPAPFPPPPVPQHVPDELSVYMTGVGGTGVVTINQILATAAHLGGWHVTGLDQTGLAQKGGPVVSHLKISRGRREVSGMVSKGQADCYLGFDVLVAADQRHLAQANPERTVAVVSTSKTATGSMIGNPFVTFPEVDLLQRSIDRSTRSADNVFFDAVGLSETLFGDAMPANLMVLGAAYQSGALPIDLESIEQSIRLNGVAVDTNLEAFRWGRCVAADPTTVSFAADLQVPSEGSGARQSPAADGASVAPEVDRLTAQLRFDDELDAIVRRRAGELVDYQGRSLAHDYLAFVERVATAERGVVDDGPLELSTAVARYLYKLMAYKDEYEVARLHLAADFRNEVDHRFPRHQRMRYHLHPPALRALGWERKITVGQWFDVVFRILRSMRRVRGTPLDLFGYSKMRRLERNLVVEYRQCIELALDGLSASTLEEAVRLANLPDIVRGYESVKLESVDRFHRELAATSERSSLPD